MFYKIYFNFKQLFSGKNKLIELGERLILNPGGTEIRKYNKKPTVSDNSSIQLNQFNQLNQTSSINIKDTTSLMKRESEASTDLVPYNQTSLIEKPLEKTVSTKFGKK